MTKPWQCMDLKKLISHLRQDLGFNSLRNTIKLLRRDSSLLADSHYMTCVLQKVPASYSPLIAEGKTLSPYTKRLF